ncbi:aldo/keto reductase [Amycolatopsis jiangsuensis]|uniref:Aryl-alcohol dehydrogenase-like predicted oxidoreductase n=1 Tax=Amycolatopsis jiangsuensis TaxID=1181879 RepID=A0A840J3G1_9PSEU|nr:aldo/keto reductase [Amycolatopsis jiangsuensis]MBB4688413.1 aryl-alcohol dehydrogenase-like predicted oxidoreductase [Amycolatopsis jiangsuensis]
MKSMPLGGTGIEIGQFVFGAGSIGGVGGAPQTRGLGITEEQGFARLDEAYELGIRVVDTADVYAQGDSEVAVGRWLSQREPSDVLVQTKFGGVARDGKPASDLSGAHLRRQLAQSIERLGRVDLYLSHVPDPDTPPEETLTAFAEAREAGLIRAFGVCNVDAGLLEALLKTAADAGLPRPEFVQNGFSLLNRADEPELLPLVRSEGLGYLAFSPLAGGVLSERYLDGAAPQPGSRIAVAGDQFYPGAHTEENLARVTRLRELARRREVSVAGLALAWLSAHPAVTAPIVSPSSETQWQAVREALSFELDAESAAEISELFG